MSLVIAEPPAVPVVTVPEFNDHAGRDDTGPGDTLAQRAIDAVTAWLAGPSGWLGRSLVAQTLRLTVPFGNEYGIVGIVLPRPPFIEVRSVAVVDAAGIATTVPPAAYYTHQEADGFTRLAFTTAFRAPVLPPGPAWLRVEYRAGYGDKGEDVDPGIRHAILMAVMRLYAGRGDPTMTLQSDPMMGDLFAAYRMWTPQ